MNKLWTSTLVAMALMGTMTAGAEGLDATVASTSDNTTTPLTTLTQSLPISSGDVEVKGADTSDFFATLTDAIAAANADDTIVLHNAIHLTAPVSITKDITIHGNGNTITADSGKQAFQIKAGATQVTFQNLTISGIDAGNSTNGGAVFINNGVTSTVTFDTCVLTGNNASQGSALFNADRSNNVTLMFIDTEVSENTSPNGYGGIVGYSGHYAFEGTTSFVDNQGATLIYTAQSVDIDDTVTFTDNWREASNNNYSLVIGSGTTLTLHTTGAVPAAPIPLRINDRSVWSAPFFVEGDTSFAPADLYKYIDSELPNTAFVWDDTANTITECDILVSTSAQFDYYMSTGEDFTVVSDLTIDGTYDLTGNLTVATDATLTVAADATLTVTGTLVVDGMVENHGTISGEGTIDGTVITFDANTGICDTVSMIVSIDGSLAQIPSATRSGYSFQGWIANGVSGYVTTQTTFDQDTTLTATYSKNSYIAPPVGGSTDGSTDSSNTTTNNDGSVNTTASPSTSTSGSITNATVSDSNVESAVDDALSAAKGESATVEIPVTTKPATDTIHATISTGSANTIAQSDVEHLVISSDIGSVTIPSGTLSNIVAQAQGDNITISLAQAENSSALSDDHATAMGDSMLVSATISSDGEVISTLEKGTMTITVPYTLKDGELAKNLVVWCVNADGSITALDATYDANTEQVSFPATQSTLYSIVHDTNAFSDVTVNDYYYNAVQWAVANNVTAGTSETTFAPNTICNRAQAVTFLWRAAGEPQATIDNPFTDLDADSYYYTAVLWAVEQGITAGTTETTFDPYASCTRGQIVTFLWRMAGEVTVSNDAMSDVAEDSYCYDAVLWAVSQGITTGYADGTFQPNTLCNRGQIVTFLYRNLAD